MKHTYVHTRIDFAEIVKASLTKTQGDEKKNVLQMYHIRVSNEQRAKKYEHNGCERLLANLRGQRTNNFSESSRCLFLKSPKTIVVRDIIWDIKLI